MTLKMIVATGVNGEIGRKNKMLWNTNNGLAYLQDKTRGGTVLMDHKVLQNLKPSMRKVGLPDSQNYILTQTPGPHGGYGENISFFYNFKTILKRAQDEDIWIIGGAELYRMFQSHVSEVHWTKIPNEYPTADAIVDMSFVGRDFTTTGQPTRCVDGNTATVYRRKVESDTSGVELEIFKLRNRGLFGEVQSDRLKNAPDWVLLGAESENSLIEKRCYDNTDTEFKAEDLMEYHL